jgi:hypothetical protein
MKKILAVALFVGISTSQAALFQGNTSGVFSNPEGGSKLISTIDMGGTHFEWGGAPTPSSATFYAGMFDIDADERFSLGKLAFTNGSTPWGTEAKGVDLSFGLSFTSPIMPTENFSFGLDIDTTGNNGTAAQNADNLEFQNTRSSNFFSFDGIDYHLEILGFGMDDDEVFSVHEYNTDMVDIWAKLSTVTQIPEPSVIALFATGLLGLAGFSRRRKSQG